MDGERGTSTRQGVSNANRASELGIEHHSSTIAAHHRNPSPSPADARQLEARSPLLRLDMKKPVAGTRARRASPRNGQAHSPRACRPINGV
jgi:hypothetical protein